MNLDPDRAKILRGAYAVLTAAADGHPAPELALDGEWTSTEAVSLAGSVAEIASWFFGAFGDPKRAFIAGHLAEMTEVITLSQLDGGRMTTALRPEP